VAAKEWSLTIAAVSEADRTTFEDVMRAQERRVLRTALRLLGRLEDAEDAAQEVFLRLYKHWAKVDWSRPVEAWLYRVTVNVCADLRRKRPMVEPLEFDPAAAGSFAAAGDARRLVEAGLQTLGEKERAAIVLRDIEGLETAEVAEILGSSEVTVRSQISTGRVKLRAFVEGAR
jgi:RNA polymerase sigma-70 factor (ECF subfamily)